jgi:hypothetical protein
MEQKVRISSNTSLYHQFEIVCMKLIGEEFLAVLPGQEGSDRGDEDTLVVLTFVYILVPSQRYCILSSAGNFCCTCKLRVHAVLTS